MQWVPLNYFWSELRLKASMRSSAEIRLCVIVFGYSSSLFQSWTSSRDLCWFTLYSCFLEHSHWHCYGCGYQSEPSNRYRAGKWKVLLLPSCWGNHTALRLFNWLSLSRLCLCKHMLFNLAQNYMGKYSVRVWGFLTWIIRLQDIVQLPPHWGFSG